MNDHKIILCIIAYLIITMIFYIFLLFDKKEKESIDYYGLGLNTVGILTIEQ